MYFSRCNTWGSWLGWVHTSSSGLCLGSTDFCSTSPMEGTALPAPPLELGAHREPPHTELPPATAAIPPAASSGPGHRRSPERHEGDASPRRPPRPAHRGPAANGRREWQPWRRERGHVGGHGGGHVGYLRECGAAAVIPVRAGVRHQ